MGLFDNFPYTNFHELNLMWILEALKEIQTTMEQFVAINALKFADPIQWNIVKQYEKNTIVIDPLTGTAYISVQPVPSGVIITNTDYWSVVFDLGSFVVRAAKNFTNKYEDETTLTATFPSNVNDWLIWGDTLYRVISPIVAGDQYVDGSNIVHFTAEDIIGHIQDLNTTDKSNLVAAINELVTTIGNLDIKVGDLSDLTTSDITSIVNAINELVTTIGNLNTKVGDLSDLTTSDITSIVNAINSVVSALDTEIENNRPINIKTFGAAGDGVNDDTTAFTTALNSNKYIYIPAGAYNINDITISNKTINVLCSSDAVFTGSIGFLQCHGSWSGGNFSKTIIINDSTKFVFENVNILNVDAGPCLLVLDSSDIKIVNCNFACTSNGSHDAIFQNSTNCVIDKCNATGTPINHNIQLHNCDSCKVIACHCANAQEFGVSIWKSAHCVVSNSVIKNTIKEGINLEGSSQNLVSGCVIFWDVTGVSTDFGLSLAGLVAGEYTNENIISDILIIGSRKSGLALAGNCINNELNQISILYPNNEGGDVDTYNAALFVYPIGNLNPTYNHFTDIQISPSSSTAYIFYEVAGSNYNIFNNFISYYTKLPIMINGGNSEYSNIYNMSPSRLTYNAELLGTGGVQLSDYTIQSAYYDDEGEYVNIDVIFKLTANANDLPIFLTLPTPHTFYFGQVTGYDASSGTPILGSLDTSYGVQLRNIDNTPLNAGAYKVSVRYQRERT